MEAVDFQHTPPINFLSRTGSGERDIRRYLFVLQKRAIQEGKRLRRFKIPLRLIVALLCGWLVAFLNILGLFVSFLEQSQGISQGASIPLLIVLLPFVLGILVAFTIGPENRHPILLAMGTALLALTGWYGYWYPIMLHTDAEAISACQGSNPPPSCHHGPFSPESYINTSLLIYSWGIGVILVLLSSAVTGWLLSLIRKHRAKADTKTEQHI